MELTPSEFDDLETTRLPLDQQPLNVWKLEDVPYQIPSFPGQLVDLDPGFKKLKAMIASLSAGPERVRLFSLDPLPSGDSEDLPPELSSPQQDATSPLPQNLRISDQRTPRAKLKKAQNQGNHPPPRRSARIANLKRTRELLCSKNGTKKRK